MYNPFTLEGKTILVTGASSGIGKATAIECSKMGAKVIITARNKDRLQETYNNLVGDGHIIIEGDLNDSDTITKIVDAVQILNGVVHCAGIVNMIPFQFINKSNIEDIMNVNFYVPILLTKCLLKKKKLSKESSIVFISSIDGNKVVHSGNSIYAASKGAISAIAKNMAIDLAPKKIRVNCILPGTIDTKLIHTDNVTNEQLEENKKQFPLQRFGTPNDIAYGVIYLLSDASCWITGIDLVVDGGYILQ